MNRLASGVTGDQDIFLNSFQVKWIPSFLTIQLNINSVKSCDFPINIEVLLMLENFSPRQTFYVFITTFLLLASASFAYFTSLQCWWKNIWKNIQWSKSTIYVHPTSYSIERHGTAGKSKNYLCDLRERTQCGHLEARRRCSGRNMIDIRWNHQRFCFACFMTWSKSNAFFSGCLTSQREPEKWEFSGVEREVVLIINKLNYSNFRLHRAM